MGQGVISRAIWLAILCAGPAGADPRGDAEQVMRNLGLPIYMQASDAMGALPRPDLPKLPMGSPKVADLQAALTQVAILSGANDLMAIVTAQPKEGSGAIYLRDGEMTLGALAKALDAAGQTGLTQQNGTYHLTRPLIVWMDARLVLSPGDSLVMDRDKGAFLISFGDLLIDAAMVSGTKDANPQNPDFAPFVLVAGMGMFWAKEAEFQSLGIAETRLFSGVTVLAKGLTEAAFPVLVQSNRFQDVDRLALIGVDGARIAGNQIAGSILVEDGSGQSILHNDVVPGRAGAGIRVANATAVKVADNLVRDGAATGIAASRGTRDLRVEGNIVRGNAGDGISLTGGACARVLGNLVEQNGAVGVRLAQTTGPQVEGNAIRQNGTAAIDLRDQAADAGTTLLRGNVLADNGEGLRGASIGAVILTANQLQDQFPRLFGGEFSAHLPAYLTATQQNHATSFQISAVGAALAASDCARGL